MIIGHLDRIENGIVFGWVYSAEDDITPYLTVNDKPCDLLAYGESRTDVANELGINGNVGFSFKLTENLAGQGLFKLHVISERGVIPVTERKMFTSYKGEMPSLASMHHVKNLSEKKNAVAIVVWDGAHNPIGRAKVLYEILVKNNRPAIIFAFDFGDFGDGLWGPLRDSSTDIVIIPWANKDSYYKYTKYLEITFPTVWICKPRKPSFELAALLANKNTKFILDIDDNESTMSISGPSCVKHYGKVGYHFTEHLIRKFSSISVASISLKEKFGGELVRHARIEKYNKSKKIDKYLKDSINIGFFGTVRPHKNLVPAARAIKILNKIKNRKLQFIVGGHFHPESSKKNLERLGVITLGEIRENELSDALYKLDIVLVGYPGRDKDQITEYQISSKIGDALSHGKPVLVPYSESVKDLDNVKGIYLFDIDNFSDVVDHVIKDISRGHKKFKLPKQFSVSHAYQVFEKLELIAFNERLLPLMRDENSLVKLDDEVNQISQRKNLLLFWKQHDGALYGRRADQVARSYAAFYPECQVHFIEIINESQFNDYRKTATQMTRDSRLIHNLQLEKVSGYKDSGVIYKSITADGFSSIEAKLGNYFEKNNCYPCNSIAILYPIVPYYPEVKKALNGYRLVADVVDNQLSWPSKRKEKLMADYKDLFARVDKIIFNSKMNMKFFMDKKFLSPDDKRIKIIENWYRVPASIDVKRVDREGTTINLIYSGNMNDRFDWQLFESMLLGLPDNFVVHLVGNANRVWEKLSGLLSYENLRYHGPMSERELINFSKICNLSIMPHLDDNLSKYMNPLKVQMYIELGLPIVTTNVLGVDEGQELIHKVDNKDFISKIISLCKESPDIFIEVNQDVSLDPKPKEKQYFNLIDGLLSKIDV